MSNLYSPLMLFLYTLTLCTTFHVSTSNQPTTIYDLLQSNGLPIGLLPEGVTEFKYDDSGRFEVHLDQACNAKFEDELHYDQDVSGNISYGQIDGLMGISAQDLFLWFPVKEIRVDVPSSGLIYFDVGVVSKQFSLSSFETPRECLASEEQIVVANGFENPSAKVRIVKNDGKEHLMTYL
ncbi:hypothetical protein M8C21_019551 [Ambrosia artemisiifolia]|uniref:Transmembrane protein n=1 Tax=Ambrosia artemisiifolia TaxID=4212 RepID=A0AAD5BVP1_AMBAR|nr:hypothetical protein M8C21_019551 [Ambrosia artemisiifolia]